MQTGTPPAATRLHSALLHCHCRVEVIILKLCVFLAFLVCDQKQTIVLVEGDVDKAHIVPLAESVDEFLGSCCVGSQLATLDLFLQSLHLVQFFPVTV
jgi:hypothetical protein